MTWYHQLPTRPTTIVVLCEEMKFVCFFPVFAWLARIYQGCRRHVFGIRCTQWLLLLLLLLLLQLRPSLVHISAMIVCIGCISGL